MHISLVLSAAEETSTFVSRQDSAILLQHPRSHNRAGERVTSGDCSVLLAHCAESG